jgi:mono/diheme cytochrome c family protein
MENYKGGVMTIANLLVICLIAVSITFFSCAARKSEPIVGKAFTPKNMRIQHGQELYMKNCQKCHPGGEGGLGPAINSNPAPSFVKKLQVRLGLGVMPSFKHQELPKQDLKDLGSYMKALKRF